MMSPTWDGWTNTSWWPTTANNTNYIVGYDWWVSDGYYVAHEVARITRRIADALNLAKLVCMLESRRRRRHAGKLAKGFPAGVWHPPRRFGYYPIMRIFLLAAFVLFIFALIVAAGSVFVTSWPVWLCAGLVAWTLDQLTGGYRFKVPQ